MTTLSLIQPNLIQNLAAVFAARTIVHENTDNCLHNSDGRRTATLLSGTKHGFRLNNGHNRLPCISNATAHQILAQRYESLDLKCTSCGFLDTNSIETTIAPRPALSCRAQEAPDSILTKTPYQKQSIRDQLITIDQKYNLKSQANFESDLAAAIHLDLQENTSLSIGIKQVICDISSYCLTEADAFLQNTEAFQAAHGLGVDHSPSNVKLYHSLATKLKETLNDLGANTADLHTASCSNLVQIVKQHLLHSSTFSLSSHLLLHTNFASSLFFKRDGSHNNWQGDARKTIVPPQANP